MQTHLLDRQIFRIKMSFELPVKHEGALIKSSFLNPHQTEKEVGLNCNYVLASSSKKCEKMLRSISLPLFLPHNI